MNGASKPRFSASFALSEWGSSKRVSRVIWFKNGASSAFRESFDSERDASKRVRSHLIQNGCFKARSRVIFDSERGFKARFASHWFRTGLQIAFHESFDSERGSSKRVSRGRLIQNGGFKARFASRVDSELALPKRVSRVV